MVHKPWANPDGAILPFVCNSLGGTTNSHRMDAGHIRKTTRCYQSNWRLSSHGQLINQSYLGNGAPNKNCGHWGMYQSHTSALKGSLSWLYGEENGGLTSGTFQDSSRAALPVADFSPYPVHVIHDDCGYNSFQGDLCVLLANYQAWESWRESAWTCSWCQKQRQSWRLFPQIL